MTTRTSAIPETYGELSERQMARDVGDQLNKQRKLVDRLQTRILESSVENALLVGPIGTDARAKVKRSQETVDGMRASMAKLVTKARCDTVTAQVTKKCDRLQGHRGRHIYSDTKDQDWVPQIPPEERGGRVR